MRRLYIPAVFLFIVLAAANGAWPAGGALSPSQAVKDTSDILWYDIRLLDVEGRGWTETAEFYNRLPAKAKGIVRDPVWSLSLDSAGMCVRFVTDATTIRARWSLRSESLDMPHMPATGVSGLDLYARDSNGVWRWLANGRPTAFPTNTADLAKDLPPGTREYMLYLPLYNGVTSVELGIPSRGIISRAEPYGPGVRKPIVFYGTSITQGGCASRPGMVYTAILGRWLNYPAINLGFSGNGRMEPEMADLLAELDPAVYVLDCLPNLSPEQVAERIEPFVARLRKSHPRTPILLAEDRTYTNAWLVQSSRERNEGGRRNLRTAYDRLKAAGDVNLYYLPGENQVGLDSEGTVDGSHSTDLGFMRQAEVFMKALAPIVGGNTP
jgi:lysophospholipase L1-like esterase